MKVEIQIWMLTGVVSALSTVLMIVFKTSLTRLVNWLDKLIDQVRELTETVGVHKNAIDSLSTKNNEQDKRLNGHSERIRELEINQNKDKSS